MPPRLEQAIHKLTCAKTGDDGRELVRWREGEKLADLDFYLALLSENNQDLQHLTTKLERFTGNVGLKISIEKNKTMEVGDHADQSRLKLDREIETRVQKANSVSYKRVTLLKHPSIPMETKAKLSNFIFLPTLTYQCQTWTCKPLERKIITSEMRCLRRLVSRTRRDKIRSTTIGQMAGKNLNRHGLTSTTASRLAVRRQVSLPTTPQMELMERAVGVSLGRAFQMVIALFTNVLWDLVVLHTGMDTCSLFRKGYRDSVADVRARAPKRWLMTERDGERQCAQPLGAPMATPGQGTGGGCDVNSNAQNSDVGSKLRRPLPLARRPCALDPTHRAFAWLKMPNFSDKGNLQTAGSTTGGASSSRRRYKGINWIIALKVKKPYSKRVKLKLQRILSPEYMSPDDATVWDPYTIEGIQAVEAVQRRAARVTLTDYRRMSSVTQMLNDLRDFALQGGGGG
ncbi:hypothetical protein Bbelb_393220 [Branchiostoma belcheri]|nr:hypothetical protein Bbelb_393220 [Branchiostoma belcheri]